MQGQGHRNRRLRWVYERLALLHVIWIKNLVNVSSFFATERASVIPRSRVTTSPTAALSSATSSALPGLDAKT
jgi:hypothetical protein